MQNENLKNKFDICGKSIKLKEKNKCGDYFKYEIINNKLVILSVADGVGSKRCDWLASETACNNFTEKCRSILNNEISKSKLLQIMKETDFEIKNTSSDCRGMLTVFAAVVWDIGTNYLYIINIGDTRIYTDSKQGLLQKSKDEVKAVIMKDKTGKILTSGGSAIIRTGVTNALGTDSAEINIEKIKFNPGESVILASDGYYNCLPTFNEDIKNAIGKPDLKASIEKLSSYYENYIKDDATILVLRRNDIDYEFINKFDIISDYYKIKNNIPKHILINLLFKTFIQNLNDKNKKNCLIILNYFEKDRLLLSENNIENIISEMKAINFLDPQIYSAIIKQLREIMKTT